jgi:putrescine:ornithine antiporter
MIVEQVIIERRTDMQRIRMGSHDQRVRRSHWLASALLAFAVLPLTVDTHAAEGAANEAAAASEEPVVETTAAPAPAPAPATGLERARGTGRLRLGYVDGARPYSYRDAAGKPAGYAVALCERIADAVRTELAAPDLEVEWVEQSFDARLDDLAEGRVDVGCSAGTVSLTDRARVAFSIPIFPGSVGALLRRDSSSRLREILEEGPPRFRPFWRASPTQLLGEQTFAVIPGAAAESFLAERAATLRLTSKIVPVTGLAEGVQAVLDRKANVFFADRALLLDAARSHPAVGDLIVLDRKFTLQPVALGLARGDEDLRLLVDRTLSRLYRSGDLVRIYEASFGEPDETTLTYFRMNVLPE